MITLGQAQFNEAIQSAVEALKTYSSLKGSDGVQLFNFDRDSGVYVLGVSVENVDFTCIVRAGELTPSITAMVNGRRILDVVNRDGDYSFRTPWLYDDGVSRMVNQDLYDLAKIAVERLVGKVNMREVEIEA